MLMMRKWEERNTDCVAAFSNGYCEVFYTLEGFLSVRVARFGEISPLGQVLKVFGNFMGT